MASLGFWYSVSGLVSGTLLFIAGLLTVFWRRTGRVEWVLQVGRMQMTLSTTVPGIVLAIVGLLVIWITRFNG